MSVAARGNDGVGEWLAGLNRLRTTRVAAVARSLGGVRVRMEALACVFPGVPQPLSGRLHEEDGGPADAPLERRRALQTLRHGGRVLVGAPPLLNSVASIAIQG